MDYGAVINLVVDTLKITLPIRNYFYFNRKNCSNVFSLCLSKSF